MVIQNIELNKKNIIIAISVAVAISIVWQIIRPLTPEEMQAKIKAEIERLDTQRKDQISALNKCIEKLNKNMGTVDGSYISDCKINSPLITEANASDKSEGTSTGSTNTGTSTGGTAPVPERSGSGVEVAPVPERSSSGVEVAPVPKRIDGTERSESKGNKLKPSELLGPVKISDDCYVTQTESDHVRPERGGMFATDIACKFGAVGGVGGKAEVYAPDLRGKAVSYKVIYVGQDNLLGSFVQLAYMNDVEGAIWDESFYLGHTETKLKVGDEVYTGQRIGQMILNGATTGWHVHFEYRRLTPSGTWASQRYFTGLKEAQLDKKRKGITFNGWKWGDTIYATTYDLGDVNQNDASPFIGASGKDMRHIEGAVALTKDVRRSLGIYFGDKIQIKSDRDGLYYTVQVEDEMNARYRESGPNDCIKPNSGSSRCIKMDMARPSNMLPSGEYTLIKKL